MYLKTAKTKHSFGVFVQLFKLGYGEPLSLPELGVAFCSGFEKNGPIHTVLDSTIELGIDSPIFIPRKITMSYRKP